MEPDLVTRVRFLADDPYGLWLKGDEADDLGWESPAVPLRVLLLDDGQEITLTNPLARGLVEVVE